MIPKAKNRLIYLFLAFLFLPFLFLTNFYPFMRFAMYADPLSTKQAHRFQLYINERPSNSDYALNIPNDIFQNWAQTYYGKGDSTLFIQKLKSIQVRPGEISVVKITQYE